MVVAISAESAKGLVDYLAIQVKNEIANDRLERLSFDINAVLIANQMPAIVGFPEYFSTHARSSSLARVGRSGDWKIYDVSLAWGSGTVSSYTLLPSATSRAAISEAFDSLAENLSTFVSIIKVRVFSIFQGHHARIRIVPIVILSPMPDKLTDAVITSIVTTSVRDADESDRIWEWRHSRKVAFVQLALSKILGEIFYSQSGFEEDGYEKVLGFCAASSTDDATFEGEISRRLADAVLTGEPQAPSRPSLPLHDRAEIRAPARRDVDTFNAIVAELKHSVAGVPRTPDQAPAYDQMSLANKVARIFGHYFDRYEANEEDLLRSLDIHDFIAKCADRTVRVSNIGLTAGELFDLLGVEPSQHEVASLAVDVAVDFGIVIPQTVEDPDGTVFRVYSIGENARLFGSVHRADRDLAYADAFRIDSGRETTLVC
jgi:hypothetical protein